MSTSNLFPLLVGVGSGAALMYFISRQNSARRTMGEINDTYESDFLNAGDHENFGKYVDAEQEIEKRQHNLKDRLESAQMESKLNAAGKTTFDKEDDTVINIEKKRSARHGNS